MSLYSRVNAGWTMALIKWSATMATAPVFVCRNGDLLRTLPTSLITQSEP
jgi:hypothetical protein